MIVWSRPSCAPLGTPFCAVVRVDDSVHTACRGRWQPSPTDERQWERFVPEGERCGGCVGAAAVECRAPSDRPGNGLHAEIGAAAGVKIRDRRAPINQCMGCQAGWPMVRPGSHAVVGGYPHERVGCTAERYGANSADLALLMLGVLGQPAVGPDGNMIVHPLDDLVPFEEEEVEITFGEIVAEQDGGDTP